MDKKILMALGAVLVAALVLASAFFWPGWALGRTNTHVSDPKEIPWLDQKPQAPTMPLGEMKAAPPEQGDAK